jgi:hypothetical protein
VTHTDAAARTEWGIHVIEDEQERRDGVFELTLSNPIGAGHDSVAHGV